MHQLTKPEAQRFIAEHAGVIDGNGGPDNPFSTSAWLGHFVAQVAAPDWTVQVPHDRVDGESMMLLYRAGGADADCLALSNYYCSLFSPVASTATDRPQAVQRLVRQLTVATPRLATIKLMPLDAAAPDTTELERALRGEHWYVRRFFCFGNWYLPCEGLSFKDYMAGRDSKLHNTWTRKSKKFFATPDNTIEIVRDAAAVEQAMDHYELIYRKSWKDAEPYPEFVRGWARLCAEHGWLRLGIAYVGGVPAAAQFWFTVNRRAYIFKLAYDEGYAQWSAGTVLSARMFEQSLDVDRVVEIDYLTGDDAYKRSWVSHRRERVGIVAHNLRMPLGLLRAAKEAAGAFRARLRRSSAAVPSPADAGMVGTTP